MEREHSHFQQKKVPDFSQKEEEFSVYLIRLLDFSLNLEKTKSLSGGADSHLQIAKKLDALLHPKTL